jgi:hypothetical protein
MATFPQTIVETKDSSRGLGHRSKSTLQQMFPGSPIHSGEIDNDFVKKQAEMLLLQGVVASSGGDWGFNPAFDRDFTDAPDIPADVTAGGGGGEPATAWVPNPSSPGEGSVSPTDMPAPPSDMRGGPDGPSNPFPASGGGATTNPSDTSLAISTKQDKILTVGQYILGSSAAVPTS